MARFHRTCSYLSNFTKVILCNINEFLTTIGENTGRAGRVFVVRGQN